MSTDAMICPSCGETCEWRVRRRGRVFRVPGKPDCVSQTIGKIGRLAGVKVDTSRTGRVKYATAHDLRRSFGSRWAPRVMPQTLMELIRHESIETTLRHYVGHNAQATADVSQIYAERDLMLAVEVMRKIG